jgi:allophanate hydrolase
LNDLQSLAQAYAGGANPSDVLASTVAALEDDDPVWIMRVPAKEVVTWARSLDRTTRAEREAMPLFGVPFAVKDNIDVAGLPTTAACPEFSYVPDRSATVVERLEAAGAILIGKTNLDQFATGLVGTRSPYGVPRNPFDARYIPGGSSSGSAVAVARGLVSFALGTDTAGSGRIPAGFTGTVGLKPTFGIISAAGVVPACRSLDCVSIFARSIDDAETVLDVAAAPDPADAFSRPRPSGGATIPARFRFEVPPPDQRIFCSDAEAQRSFEDALQRLEQLGGEAVEVDLAPCFAAADLLYNGAYVAERTAAFGDFAAAHPGALLEVTRAIVDGGRRFTAIDAFRAQYRIRELRAQAMEGIFARAPFLVVPTAPTIYTLDQIAAEPFALNATLGTYTNFVNLFDLCALAIPSGRYRSGIPIGLTLIAPAFSDAALAAFARRLPAAGNALSAASGQGGRLDGNVRRNRVQ